MRSNVAGPSVAPAILETEAEAPRAEAEAEIAQEIPTFDEAVIAKKEEPTLAIVDPKFEGGVIEELQNATGGTVQAPMCRPWDREDLLKRLATFKSMTWFAKPEQTVGMDARSVEAKTDNSAKEQGGVKMEERSSPTTSNHLPSLASSELKMSTTCLELQILFEMEMQLYIVILALDCVCIGFLDWLFYNEVQQEDCVTFQKNASIPITLKSREYEVFTVAPIKKLSGEDQNGGSRFVNPVSQRLLFRTIEVLAMTVGHMLPYGTHLNDQTTRVIIYSDLTVRIIVDALPHIAVNLPTISDTPPSIAVNLPTIADALRHIAVNLPTIVDTPPAIAVNLPTIADALPFIAFNKI
ncbi:uncharacterized protein LOC112502462 [Cynara cardunculus var. scolymus]|uniref:uncharacterized protein LOC112502462 n=1 Tax=Cynara cardunculus var. scolymus TaxID=59895 RepID=UPI000D6276CC|nr:uncharacterized protein LOC112502462 [Cynara cardunculus var. scolymus]